MPEHFFKYDRLEEMNERDDFNLNSHVATAFQDCADRVCFETNLFAKIEGRPQVVRLPFRVDESSLDYAVQHYSFPELAVQLSLESYFCTVYSVTLQSAERRMLPRRSGNVRFIGMGNPRDKCPPRFPNGDPASTAAAFRAARSAAQEQLNRLMEQFQMRENRRRQNEDPLCKNREDQMKEQRERTRQTNEDDDPNRGHRDTIPMAIDDSDL